jgi:hypothetical protein
MIMSFVTNDDYVIDVLMMCWRDICLLYESLSLSIDRGFVFGKTNATLSAVSTYSWANPLCGMEIER